MSCHVKSCNCVPETEDGFCEKHGYYSTCDETHIVKHVKEYLAKIESDWNMKNKLDICLNLWFYLTYKKNFILKHHQYHTAVIKKGEEIITEMQKLKYTKKLDRFNNLHMKVKEFK